MDRYTFNSDEFLGGRLSSSATSVAHYYWTLATVILLIFTIVGLIGTVTTHGSAPFGTMLVLGIIGTFTSLVITLVMWRNHRTCMRSRKIITEYSRNIGSELYAESYPLNTLPPRAHCQNSRIKQTPLPLHDFPTLLSPTNHFPLTKDPKENRRRLDAAHAEAAAKPEVQRLPYTPTIGNSPFTRVVWPFVPAFLPSPSQSSRFTSSQFAQSQSTQATTFQQAHSASPTTRAGPSHVRNDQGASASPFARGSLSSFDDFAEVPLIDNFPIVPVTHISPARQPLLRPQNQTRALFGLIPTMSSSDKGKGREVELPDSSPFKDSHEISVTNSHDESFSNVSAIARELFGHTTSPGFVRENSVEGLAQAIANTSIGQDSDEDERPKSRDSWIAASFEGDSEIDDDDVPAGLTMEGFRAVCPMQAHSEHTSDPFVDEHGYTTTTNFANASNPTITAAIGFALSSSTPELGGPSSGRLHRGMNAIGDASATHHDEGYTFDAVHNRLDFTRDGREVATEQDDMLVMLRAEDHNYAIARNHNDAEGSALRLNAYDFGSSPSSAVMVGLGDRDGDPDNNMSNTDGATHSNHKASKSTSSGHDGEPSNIPVNKGKGKATSSKDSTSSKSRTIDLQLHEQRFLYNANPPATDDNTERAIAHERNNALRMLHGHPPLPTPYVSEQVEPLIPNSEMGCVPYFPAERNPNPPRHLASFQPTAQAARQAQEQREHELRVMERRRLEQLTNTNGPSNNLGQSTIAGRGNLAAPPRFAGPYYHGPSSSSPYHIEEPPRMAGPYYTGPSHMSPYHIAGGQPGMTPNDARVHALGGQTFVTPPAAPSLRTGQSGARGSPTEKFPAPAPTHILQDNGERRREQVGRVRAATITRQDKFDGKGPL